MKKKIFSMICAMGVCCSMLTGCDLIDYHPYDTKISGAHHINSKNISLIEERCANRDSVTFAVISDTQRWYDEMKVAVNSINARTDIDFVVHCGDMSDFGATKEFVLQRDIMQKLNVPYVVVIGNHDCLGTGADAYRYIFGDLNFSFNAGNTHFVCLNTNALEYDYSTPVPDFEFIRADRESIPASVTHTVAVMHAMPHSEQFNNNVAEIFEQEVMKYPTLRFCLCGHDHSSKVLDLFGDGVSYYECGAGKRREYLVFTLKKNGGHSYEVVRY